MKGDPTPAKLEAPSILAIHRAVLRLLERRARQAGKVALAEEYRKKREGEDHGQTR